MMRHSLSLSASFSLLSVLFNLLSLEARAAEVVDVPGKLLVRKYEGIPGAAVSDLTSSPKYPDQPTSVDFWDVFGPFPGTGNNLGDNYGLEITGFLVPNVTADYEIYLRSDDASVLFLSTDETPVNAVQIAVQTGCCNVFTHQPGTLSSNPIHLEAGRKYYLRAYLKEGPGGDWIFVGWRNSVDDVDITVPPNGPIPGEYLATSYDASASVTISQQPANQTVAANAPAQFTVGFSSFGALWGSTAKVQWQKAAAGSFIYTDIDSAVSATLKIAFAKPADNGTRYRAIVSSGDVVAISDAATLTISGSVPVMALHGLVEHRYWSNIFGNVIDALLSDQRFPNNPTFISYEPLAEYPPNGGDEGGSNYGNRLRGWVVPPETGNYVFFVSSDDPGELYLSTDDDPLNKKLIAVEGSWSNAREWVSTANNVADPVAYLADKRSDKFPRTEWPAKDTTNGGALITLQAGRHYYFEALHTEGTGGDNVGVAWRKPSDSGDPFSGDPPINGADVDLLYALTAVIINAQPQSRDVPLNTHATFTVAATGPNNSPLTYLWQTAPANSSVFVKIGGTGPSLTTPLLTADDQGRQYRVLVISPAGAALSSVATVNLTADNVAPVVTSFSGGLASAAILFSEPIDAVSGGTVANYGFSPDGTVVGATVTPASNGGSLVTLALTGLSPGVTHNLQIQNVQDTAGNTMAPVIEDFLGYGILANFDNGLPEGAFVTGAANVKPSGGFGGTGFMEITPNANSQQGTLAFDDVLNGGDAIKATIQAKIYIGDGSGNPADGMSISIDGDIDPATASTGEDGTSGGLAISFDTFDNGGGEAPAIDVMWHGVEIARAKVPKVYLVNNRWVDIFIQMIGDPLTGTASVTVIHNNTKYIDNEEILGWAPIAAPKIVIGGRTGGDYERNWLDNLSVIYNEDVPQPTDNDPPVVTAFSGGLTLARILFNEPIDLNVDSFDEAFVLSPNGTITLFSISPASNGGSLVTMAFAGLNLGETYNLTIHNVQDLVGNTMAPVTKSFVAYSIFANFNDGLPEGAFVTGAANVKTSGGFSDTGFMEVTPGANGLQGTVTFDDVLWGDDAIKATIRAKIYIGDGSGNPADGMSISIDGDVNPATASTGEEGTSGGLTVAFDTYDNGGGEAPAIDVKWHGVEVSSFKVSKETLVNNKWVDVFIQMIGDPGNGTALVTVIHDNVKYHDNVQISGWAPIFAPKIVIGARTGGEYERHWLDNLVVIYNEDVPEPLHYTLSLPAKFSMIANQLNNDDNTLNSVLPNVPLGTTVYLLDTTSTNLSFKSSVRLTSVWAPNYSVPPGTGFFIQLAAPTNLTLSGIPQMNGLSQPILHGYNLIASKRVISGLVSSTLGVPTGDGDQVFKFNRSLQSYSVSTFDALLGHWDPPEPTIEVGESFWFRNDSGTDTWNESTGPSPLPKKQQTTIASESTVTAPAAKIDGLLQVANLFAGVNVPVGAAYFPPGVDSSYRAHLYVGTSASDLTKTAYYTDIRQSGWFMSDTAVTIPVDGTSKKAFVKVVVYPRLRPAPDLRPYSSLEDAMADPNAAIFESNGFDITAVPKGTSPPVPGGFLTDLTIFRARPIMQWPTITTADVGASLDQLITAAAQEPGTGNPVGGTREFYIGTTAVQTLGSGGAVSLIAVFRPTSDIFMPATNVYSLTVRSPATVTITASSLSQTYDGTGKSVVVQTVPNNLPVTITYNGNSTAPANVGDYSVDVTVNDPAYFGSASGTLNIAQANATVTFDVTSLTQVFDGSPKSVTANTSPGGLAVGVLYNGSATAPTAAGTYSVTATVNDANYKGTANGSLVINKASAIVTLSAGSLSQVYDGSPKTVTTSASPTGLAVSILYNGSATPPTAAGTYSVTATVNDANYTGTASGSLVINKANATVTLSAASLSQVYDGLPKSVTASASPGGLTVQISYGGSATAPTAAGTYAVTASVVDANYTGSASGSLMIAKEIATVTFTSGTLARVYDASPKPVTVATSPASLAVDISYNGSTTAPTAAGTYPVTATVNNANYSGSVSGTLVIGKANATVTLDAASLSQVYNGAPKPVTATVLPGGLTLQILYAGSANAPTAAGTYAVTANVVDANYTGSASGSLVIAKAVATVTLDAATLARVYDGSPKAATANTSPSGLAVNILYSGGATAPTAVGTYPVTATVNDANYTGTASGSLIISKAAATVTFTAASLSQLYDGSPKLVIANTSPSGLAATILYNGSATAPTAAGTYPVTATINDANYTGTASGSLVINKASATVTLNAPSLSQVYDGSPKAAAATVSPGGLTLQILYGASATAPTTAGSYAVTATVVDANYTGLASDTLVISKGLATVTFNPASLDQVFDGAPKTVSATAVPSGLTLSILYNGSVNAPSAKGTYPVMASVVDVNYSGSAISSLVIRDGATIALNSASLTQTYNGSPKLVTVSTTPSGLTVNILYNGSLTAPTAAGTYTVTATINNPPYTGVASGSLIVSKAPATVTLDPSSLNRISDGSPKPVTVSVSPSGLALQILYNGASSAPSAAGAYPVTANVIDANYAGSANGTLEILPNAAQIENFGYSNGGIQITILSANGLDYILEYKDALDSVADWITLSHQTGTGGSISFEDRPDSATQRYYRLRIE